MKKFNPIYGENVVQYFLRAAHHKTMNTEEFGDVMVSNIEGGLVILSGERKFEVVTPTRQQVVKIVNDLQVK